MKIIKDYTRLLLFVGGALIGVQVPSFVDQYGQRLEAHLSESKTGLNEFQKDADKFFAGDIAKLVQHYKRNNDPVFNDGGQSIETLVNRRELLSNAMNAFNGQFYSPYIHTLATPLVEIRNETWSSYDYSIRLNLISIVWALSFGLIIAILTDLFLALLSGLFRFTNKSPTAPSLGTSPSQQRTPPEL